MELGSRVENKSLAALDRVCEKALHITRFDATCKFMTCVYIEVIEGVSGPIVLLYARVF